MLEFIVTTFNSLASDAFYLIKSFCQSWLLPIITPIASWVFVYVNSRSLSRHSETGAIVNKIDNLLKDITDASYAFWKTHDNSDLSEKARLFNCNIEHKCHLIEDGIELVKRRSSRFISKSYLNKPLLNNFYEDSLSIIGCIRDFSTLDSENTEMNHEQRLHKINKVQHHSRELSLVVNDFFYHKRVKKNLNSSH